MPMAQAAVRIKKPAGGLPQFDHDIWRGVCRRWTRAGLPARSLRLLGELGIERSSFAMLIL